MAEAAWEKIVEQHRMCEVSGRAGEATLQIDYDALVQTGDGDWQSNQALGRRIATLEDLLHQAVQSIGQLQVQVKELQEALAAEHEGNVRAWASTYA